ncbi:MAG: hypothetical protein FK734_17925 [Asgard group archaeon]|nr:hypothetical protein [Asgard group archaeon]
MKKIRFGIVFVIFTFAFIIGALQYKNNFTIAHSSIAYPTEIFSLWNDTAPTIDGIIQFDSSDISKEWSSAAVYNMYSSDESLGGKLIRQNTNNYLYAALDMIVFQVEDPSNSWGSSIFFDIDHNGILTSIDRLIRFTDNITGQFVEFLSYSTATSGWIFEEGGSLGTPLAISNILVASSYQISEFNDTNDHRQYEFRIPFSAIQCTVGDVLGVGFEATDNYGNPTAGVTWPYIGTSQDVIRTKATRWGDLHLEVESEDNFQFVVEKNLNIRTNALGYNNGTFLTTGDIDGNGDSELIVSSNRSISVDERNMIAIFDYQEGSYQRIWSSWTTSHHSTITSIMSGIATFDFDGDGSDELYAVGTSNTILRFRGWNSTLSDFNISEVIFTHTNTFTGYIAIDDATDDGLPNIVAGDQNGNIIVLDYNSGTNNFSQNSRSPATPAVLGNGATRIHAVRVGDPDDDGILELLTLFQTDADNSVSTTRLGVYYVNPVRFVDNVEDDLPKTSTLATQDHFGHTIVIGDVYNDGDNEVVIVGQDYLKIFDGTTYTDPSPPLEFSLNDGSFQPSIIGGAAIADVDLDGKNELIFSSNNGTIYIGQASNSTGTWEFNLNWSGDFGSSFGMHNSILVYDIDNDGQNEIILGDQYGQILVLGKGKVPTISINSPSPGSSTTINNVLVNWDASSEFIALHHTDVYVDGVFQKRVGGSQRTTEVFLSPYWNEINLTTYSMSGVSSSTTVSVNFDVHAPQINILSPVNNYLTKLNSVTITYNNTDLDDDFLYYNIYVNGSDVVLGTTLESYSVPLISDGKWNITVVGVDSTALEGKSSIYVIRDTTGPNIEITSPNDGDAVKNKEVDVNWDAFDETTSIAYYRIFLDNIFQKQLLSGNSYTVNLTTDKSYLIKVYAFDLLNNSASDSITITLDTVHPTVAFDPIALPQLPDTTYYTNSQSLSVSWDAIDNLYGTGIDYTKITINGLLYDTYSATNTSDTLDLGADDYKEIEITTYDLAGNEATDVFGLKLDRVAPTITINVPADNYTTGSEYVLISWDAEDTGVGVERYEIYVNSTLEYTIYDSGTTTYFIQLLENKTYVITVRAIDYLDYYNESTVNILHDSTYPTIVFTTPTKLTTYYNESTVYFTWDTVNLDIDHFEIYVNNTYYDSYSNTTFDAYILFPDIDNFEVYNITIYGFLANGTSYIDFRWVEFDTSPPQIAFISPGSDTITEDMMTVSWSSLDLGSGLDYFIIEIDNISVYKDAVPTFSTIIDVAQLDGSYELTIFAYDLAGNVANISKFVEISLTLPSFTTSLAPLEYKSSGNFQFVIYVDEPGIGIMSIVVYADNTNEVQSWDYGTNYKTEPFNVTVTVEESDFLSQSGLHNLSVSIFDKVPREVRTPYNVIIDTSDPLKVGDPVLDSFTLTSGTYKVEISPEAGTNNHILSVYVSDNYGISGVNVTLTGPGYNQTFQMSHVVESRALITLGKFEYTFNFDDFEIGDYQITITIWDVSGRNVSYNYNLEFVEMLGGNPTNLALTIALIAATIIILGTVLAVALTKPIRNIGWQEEIVSISYILKSGLTVFYVPFSEEMETDEQLFGGAMSGIRGILGELIGGETKYKVENVEFGKKNLLIYTTNYGDAVLMVRTVKPIYITKLEQFVSEFEFIYKESLKDDTHVNISNFKGSVDVIEKHFGVPATALGKVAQITRPLRRKEKVIAEAMEDVDEAEKDLLIKSLHQKLSLDEKVLDHISQQTKIYIGDAIILAEKALTSLISYDHKQAEKYAKAALNSIEIARQSGENLSVLRDVMNAIPKIVEEVLRGTTCCTDNDTEGLYMAIENVSKLYLEYIEKFSMADSRDI